jgi:hypothetical protein
MSRKLVCGLWAYAWGQVAKAQLPPHSVGLSSSCSPLLTASMDALRFKPRFFPISSFNLLSLRSKVFFELSKLARHLHIAAIVIPSLIVESRQTLYVLPGSFCCRLRKVTML